MLDGRRLEAALGRVPLVERRGPFHRYVLHKFIADALRHGVPLHVLTGEWAVRSGGRFNYPGRHRTTYLAADAVTAQREAERITAPYVHVPVEGEIKHVLDLTDAANQTALGVSPPELTDEWRRLNGRGIEASTQKLGRAAFLVRRIEAIAYPSTVNLGGVCLAVFPDRLGLGSFLALVDPEGIVQEKVP